MVHAALEKTPAEFYDKTHFMTNKTLVTVIYVPNVNEAFERVSRSSGVVGFGFVMMDCSFLILFYSPP